MAAPLSRRRPQYRIFELSFDDISSTLDSATRGVTCASWLSVISRKEFTRFREFISWLRFGKPGRRWIITT